MSDRKPKPLSALAATDERGGRSAKVSGYVDMILVYDGMKTRPIDKARLTVAEALSLAEQLIRAARKA